MPPRFPALRRAIRSLPAVSVATLLLLVWRAQLPSFAESRNPALCSEGYVHAADFIQSVAYPDIFTIAVQPMWISDTMGNVAYHVTTGGSPATVFLHVDLRDPETGAPRLDTVLLASLPETDVPPGVSEWVSGPLDRPLVLDSVLGTFSTASGTVSLVLDIQDAGGVSIDIDPDGDPHLLPAYRWTNEREPIQGSNPQLAHTFCADPRTGTGLTVLQNVLAVTSSDVASSTITYQRVQAFTVPVDGEVEWIELAIPEGLPPGEPVVRTIEIRDAQGQLIPPPGAFTPTASATTFEADPTTSRGGWFASVPFSVPVRLSADRVYWLVVHEDDSRPLGTYASGWPAHPYATRAANGEPFVEIPGALSFRMVGRSTPILPAPSPACPSPFAAPGYTTATFVLGEGERAAISFDPPCTVPIEDIGIPLAMPFSDTSATTTLLVTTAAPDGRPRTDTYPLVLEPYEPNPSLQYVTGILDRRIVLEELPGVAQSAGDRIAIEIPNTGSVPIRVGLGAWDGAIACSMFLDDGRGGGYTTASSTASIDICPSSDPGDDEIRVLQQVIRVTEVCCPSSTPGPLFEFVETFSVPVDVRVDWIELALPAQPTASPLDVSVHDAGGVVIPPPGPFTPTTTHALLDPSITVIAADRWLPLELSDPATLIAGKLYWLRGSLSGEWLFGTDVEGSPRGAGGGNPYPGGTFSSRQSEGEPFIEDPTRDLSFRLIGVPLALVGIANPPAAGAPLGVRATPLPFRSGVEIVWSALGLTGPDERASIEIVDATGRLVRRAERLRFAGEGRFAWDARDDAGRTVSPGVYFARVSTGSNARAIKIVRVR